MNAAEKPVGGVKFKRKGDLIGASIDNDLVMMSVESGQYYGLAGVAPRLWEIIEVPHTFDQLVEQILKEFDVQRSVCEKDLSEFLDRMKSLGLIESC